MREGDQVWITGDCGELGSIWLNCVSLLNDGKMNCSSGHKKELCEKISVNIWNWKKKKIEYAFIKTSSQTFSDVCLLFFFLCCRSRHLFLGFTFCQGLGAGLRQVWGNVPETVSLLPDLLDVLLDEGQAALLFFSGKMQLLDLGAQRRALDTPTQHAQTAFCLI